MSCQHAFDHSPGEVCQHCKLQVDAYGNTEDDFRNCSFPMAGAANENAQNCNVEGMYFRTDAKALKARMDLIGLCLTQPAQAKLDDQSQKV